MAPTLKTKNQRGFTLIEALFSAIVLGIGLLALAGFQAVAMQDGGAVKMRMVATNLAQEKLDDLKGFVRLKDDTAIDEDGDGTNNNDCAAGKFCYSEIAANAGGKEDTATGSLILASGSVTVSGTVYTRNWTVVCYVDTANAAPTVTGTCTAADAKMVTVTISWTDKQGTQSVSLQSMIYALDPADAASAAANPFPANKPQVNSSAPADEPGTSTDKGTQKSSKPLPTVSSKGYSLSTSFETLVYNTSGKLVSKQENKTINCVCEFSASTGSAYPASYIYWNDGNLAVKVPASTITKTTGFAPTIQGDTQDVLCDVCCRDHHDSELPSAGSPTTALYDPDRPTTDYISASGNHKHYYYTDTDCATNPNDAACDKTQGLSAVTSGLYLESCRLRRVDGIWRVMQDWAAQDMVVVPNGYLDTATSTRTLYETYKSDLLRYLAYSQCMAASGTGCNTITQVSAPSKSSLTGRDLTGQSELTYHQWRAYALYVDRVYSRTAPRTLDSSYYTKLAKEVTDFQTTSTDLTWRGMLPFNEVNVTLFASWNSTAPSIVTVANETIRNIDSGTSDYYGVYRRGLTQVQNGSGGNADIYAYLLPSNSGLNGGVTRETYTGMEDYNGTTLAASGTVPYSSEIGIDRHDHATEDGTGNDLRKVDHVNIARTGTATSGMLRGQIISGNSSASMTVTVSASNTPTPIACTVTSFGVDGAFTATYECPVGNSYSGTVAITSSTTGAFFDYGTDKADMVYDTEKNDGYASSFAVNSTNCTQNSGNWDCGLLWVFGPKISITGLCTAGGYATSLCSHNKVVISANGADPSTSDNAACDTGSAPTCGGLTLNNSHTWTGTIGVTSTLTGASGKPSHWDNDSNCLVGAATTANTVLSTASFSVGPTDATEAFNLCVSDE